MAATRRFVGSTLWMTLGLVVWAVHLGVVYAVAAIACARPAAVPGETVVVAIGIATAVAIAVVAVALLRALRRLAAPLHADREAGRFIDWTAAAVAAIGLVAIAWTALPAVVFPGCAE